nr:hypothetical protein [Tanacetum cinerariifolium]
MDGVMMAAAEEGDGRLRVAGVGVNGGGDEGGRWWMRDGDGLEVRREVKREAKWIWYGGCGSSREDERRLVV